MVEQLEVKHLNPGTIEYEDEYVKVDSEKGVYIKRYFFPTMTSKHIPWKSIKNFEWWQGKHQALPGIDYKGWGMAMTTTWWAFDFSRIRADHEVIIIYTGSIFSKGFTCKDPKTFISILKQHQHKHLGHPEEEGDEKEDPNVDPEKEFNKKDIK